MSATAAVEYDVFLSHSSADKDVVREFADKLKADGQRVWFDEWCLDPGAPINATIDEGLARSRTLLFFVSERAVTSDWARLELEAARFSDPMNRNRRAIAVRLDDQELPSTLQPFAYIDWRQRSPREYERLLAALRSTRTPPPPPHSVAPALARPGLIPPRGRIWSFALAGIVVLTAAAAGALVVSPLAAVAAPLPVLGILAGFRHRILARFSRHARVQAVSLAVVYLSSWIYFLTGSSLSAAVAAALATVWSAAHVPAAADPTAFNLLLAWAVGGATLGLNVVLYRREISHAARNPDTALSGSVTRGFDATLERYCRALVADLDRYDRDVNWSDHDLTPLEAEVEAEQTHRLRPRIVADLVKAIRRDRTSGVFIVLGDPGSGKSVSLRRLVRVLCEQARETGVVPVYVNLREFPAGEELTIETLVSFVRETALRSTGRDGRAFLDAWYEPFRRSGRLFVVIDSFDELPAVLDSDDRSDSHKRISATFDRFFTQEIQGCRAVLASRHFRAPVGVKGTRLVIRPFSERQIRRAMRTWLVGQGVDTDRYIRRLFREHPHLVPALRNPFTAELIADYARRHHGEELPGSLFAVFDQYLSERFGGDREVLARLGVTPGDVRTAAATIASLMYKSQETGLEATVEQVQAMLVSAGVANAAQTIEALRYTRIARVGGRDRQQFSFVHRRFAEFFVVEAMRADESEVPFESIPSDSRWRDCLVMYCGVAAVDAKRRIAEYCWSVIAGAREAISAGRIDEARPAIHCSRFLADAFRSDTEALESFRPSLGALVLELLKSDDLLVAKIAAELIPLTTIEDQRRAIPAAFATDSQWISETALGACRHLAVIDRNIYTSIRRYLRSMSTVAMFVRFDDLAFTLSLSDAFRPLRRSLSIDAIEVLSLLAAVTAAAVAASMFRPDLLVWAVFGTPVVLFILWSLELFEQFDSDGHTSLLARLGYLIGRGFPDIALRAFAGVLSGRMAETVSLALILRNTGRGVALTAFGSALLLNPLVAALPDTIRFTIVPLSLTVSLAVLSILLWPAMFGLARLMSAPPELRASPFNAVRSIVISYDYWPIVMLLCVYAVIGGLMLWVPPVRNVLSIVFGVTAALAAIGVGGFLCYGLIARVLRDALDRRRMNTFEVAGTVTAAAIYSTCLSLRSPALRSTYLQAIRRKRVPVVGEVPPPPSELVGDRQVAEELARLREQWLGLAG